MNEILQITEPQNKQKFSIFSCGFRPFFFVAGLYAILPLLVWILYLNEIIDPDISMVSWHAHEMLFGFVAAAINGFLLTAVPKWTNTPSAKGNQLKLIFSLWIIGRIVFWLILFSDHPIFKLMLFLDLLLPIYQINRLGRLFIKANSKRNFIIVAILTILTIANLLVILDINNFTSGTAKIGFILAANTLLMMIAIIAGRVTPNFTRGYLQGKNIPCTIRSFRFIEISSIALLAAIIIADLIAPHSLFSSIVALLAFSVHLIRFSFWQSTKTLDNPILWVLHLGYIWFLATLFLKGSEYFFDLPYSLYLHALTVGTLGTFIIGIMSRASLGHTGRALQAKLIIVTAYILITLAAITRIITPFNYFDYNLGVNISSLFWVSAFTFFLWIYTPIFFRPRADGKPD